MELSLRSWLLSLLSLALGAYSAAPFEQDCAALATRLNIANTTVYFTQFLAAGSSFATPDTNVTCAGMSLKPSVKVDLCRVAAYTATSNRSGINFETWLPKNWTGRFISHGNGGLSGCIAYGDLAYSTSHGFAAVSANSGHNGTSGGSFYQNPEVVADFVWRSLHTGVVVGKDITKAFYGKAHTKSYYLGCSTGGRQGFKAVQDHPSDFDGVVAGAPAFSFNNLTSWSGNFFTITGPPNSLNFIPSKLWPMITKDTMAQCDALDGHVDGILESPELCNYDPKGLLCKAGGNSSACLTAAQINTLRQFYQPLVQTDGSIIYPRLNPGSGSPSVASGSPFPFTVDWFRYAIYQDPTWDAAKLSLKDMAYASRLNPSNAETWNGDLSAFKAHGSKVIHYHGHEDSLISSTNSARYYEHVRSTMKLAPAQLDEFYRYFQISGTGHCGGGSGASQIGQGASSAVSLDPDSNVLFAIVRWVERGVAPDTIKGTKFVNSQTKEIQFQRKHCRYPKRNKYAGTGDPTKASSWNCVD